MVSTLTTRVSIGGGALLIVAIAALYFLRRRKESNSDEGADEGREPQDRNANNSEKDGKDKGGKEDNDIQGRQGEGEGPSTQGEKPVYTSMISFEMVNKEDIDAGEDKGGGNDQREGNDSVTQKEQKEANIQTSSVNSVKQAQNETVRVDDTKSMNGKESVENVVKNSEQSGLMEVSEELQASLAKVLNSKVEEDIPEKGNEQESASPSQQIDRKEDFVSHAVQSKDKVVKTESKVPTSSGTLNGTHTNDDTSESEGKFTKGNSVQTKKEFSQEDIKTAIILSQNSPGVVSSQNADVLVSLLSCSDVSLLQAALTGINKCSTFTRNQNLLRDHGCLPLLSELLKQHKMSLGSDQKLLSSVALAVNNMAVNEKNNKEMKDCVPSLVDIALEDETGEALCLSTLQALTNLSVMPDHHGCYTRIIQRLYDFMDNKQSSIKLQAAKVLVNLSCSPDMVPHMLAAKAPSCLLDLLRIGVDDALLLRWTTILANVLTTAKQYNLSSASLPPDDKAPSPETMYSALYGMNSIGQIKSKVFLLCRHRNEDVKGQATRIYQTLNAR